MTQAKSRFRTFEEYAALDPSELPEGNYELVDGVIVEMGAENDQNLEIVSFLFSVFLQFVPYNLLRRGTEIAVPSRLVTSRFPDLTVLAEETRAAMKRDRRSLIESNMPAPRLIVEVVSPGEPGSDNYDRDYIEKPKEYAQRGISEFWLIDPARSVVWVLKLEGSSYKAAEFRGSDRIESEQFQQLNLTAQEILAAGEVV
ncbi:Uma2 family endonuclease [Oculatella sp. LEGE 06141]|uniref:Uma2 family endonuclease n=1 Tax=Oculatella sp. LEGE 06141 TaxID=1828648 RepID=UPI00187E8095|nr:Uma2 family endonuclease [Oculatella sp. LEGE 06141]MBE9182532.1 Uma2 family endonuclease [Oculatella sp. LEGE 06141]